MTILTILGVTEILGSFRLVLDGKTGKKISESLRLKFLEKFLGNNFALSDAKVNTCGLFNREGVLDLLLLRRLAICEKSWEPSFWEVMFSFVLLAYASLAISRTYLQQLLACLNLTLDSENILCSYKWKKLFLWTMAATQLWKRVRFDLIFMMKDIYIQKRIPSTLITATTSIHLPKSVSTNLTVKLDLKISFLSNPIWSARLVVVICFCSLHVVVLFFQASCGIVSYVSLKFPILIQRV